MNWLAHIVLSPRRVEHQLGNLLADVLKGRVWPGMSNDMRAGIQLHFAIDAFTDAHPCWMNSRDRLGESGHLRGVVVDLAYDHLLARNWAELVDGTLREFLDDFYEQARLSAVDFPSPARDFIEALIASDRLGRYGTVDGVADAMHRIDSRLSPVVRRRETTTDYLPAFVSARREMEDDFLKFFPELRAHAKDFFLS